MPKQTDIKNLDRLSPFSFVCGRCSACCTNKKIQVNPYEITRLATQCGLTTTKFIQDKTEKGVYLQRHSDGTCLFLGKDGCSVHPNRPLVCRLYPLCRYVSSEESETFTVAELTTNCQGVINEGGTVATYLVSQDLAPYLQAADLYLGLFARLVEALSKEVSQEGSSSLPDWVYKSPGDDLTCPFPDLLDVDQVIDKEMGSRVLTPGDPDKKIILHIKAIEKWLDAVKEDDYEK
jgi:Fe-S-cluster containining protein